MERIESLIGTLKIAEESGNKEWEGSVHRSIGVSYQETGNFEKAVKHYEAFLQTQELAQDMKGVEDAHRNLGSCFLSLSQYEEALKHFRVVLDIAKDSGDKQVEGTTIGNLATCHTRLGQHEQALALYEIQLNNAQGSGDKAGEGIALRKLGTCYQCLGQYDKAIEYYEMQRDIEKRVGNERGEGIALANLGNCYRGNGQYDKAIEVFEIQLEIAKRIGDKVGETSALGGLGSCYQYLGHSQKALELYQMGLTIAIEMGDKSSEATFIGYLGTCHQSFGEYVKAIEHYRMQLKIAGQIGDKVGQGAVIGNLGTCYRCLGQYHKAVDHFEMHLRISKEIGDKRGEVTATGNLGCCYQDLGQYHKAIKHHETQLKIGKEIGDKENERAAIGNLGRCYRYLGEYHKAMEHFEMHLKISKEIGDKLGEGTATGNLGNCYQGLGQYSKAVELHQMHLNISKEIGDKRGEGTAFGNLGNCYQSLGQYSKAMEHHAMQLEIAKQIRDVKSEAVAFNNLGMSLYSCGLYEKAEECCRKSAESYEKLFENTPRQDCFKVSITDTFVDAYRLLAKILLLRGNTKESLMVADRGRSRALAELLIETGHRQPSTSVPASKALVFDDVIELSKAWYSTVIFFAFLEGGIHTWAIQPDGSCICVRPEERLPHLTDSFVFQKGDLNLIQETVKQCQGFNEFGESPTKLHLKSLYKILFSPVRHLIQGSQVVVVPDGPLWLVPFAALIDEDDDYLSDTVHLRLVPSLRTAKMIMERPEEQYTVETCPLIVGDPDVGEVRVGEEVVPVPRLPFANREVKLIGQMLNVEPLTAERATKDGFLEKVGSASLIHIASHGDYEGILLASGPGGITRVEDVMLTMSDLEHRHVRAKLVVLSCVRSGRGEVRAEGIIGIARAFLGAGARAVVGSLWAIDDRSTMYFMKAFYEHLSCGETASEALNNARKSVRQTKGLHHPRYWASFVLIGDDVAPFACESSDESHKKSSGVHCETLAPRTRSVDEKPCKPVSKSKEAFQRNKHKLLQFHKKFCSKGRVKESINNKLKSLPRVLMVQRGQNTNWTTTGEYGGLSINVFVSCSPEEFLSEHPEYKDEPYVIVTCPTTGRFREQIFDGQFLWCTDECSSDGVEEKSAPGTVGYWVAESEHTYLGITAFHVLDFVTQYSGVCENSALYKQDEFEMHADVCCRSDVILKGRSYKLEDGNGLTCSYVCGLFNESFDVGVVRCKMANAAHNSVPPNGVLPSSTVRQRRSLFEWPRILHTLVTKEGYDLRGILLDYESIALEGRKLSIYHNGKSSREKGRVGHLLTSEDSPVAFLSGNEEEGEVKLGPAVVAVEGEVPEECLEEDILYDLLEEYATASVGQTDEVNECPDEVTEEKPSGDLNIETIFSAECQANDRIIVMDEKSEAEEDGKLNRCGTRELGDKEKVKEDEEEAEKEQKEEDDGGSEFEDHSSNQPFTNGGDSGCCYFIKVEQPDGHVLDAPIGIHRGVFEDPDNQQRNCSYASNIGDSLEKIAKKGFNLWFTIREDCAAVEVVQQDENEQTPADPRSPTIPCHVVARGMEHENFTFPAPHCSSIA